MSDSVVGLNFVGKSSWDWCKYTISLVLLSPGVRSEKILARKWHSAKWNIKTFRWLISEKSRYVRINLVYAKKIGKKRINFLLSRVVANLDLAI